MSYFVYIVECADGTLYSGSTTDLDRRLSEHNTSKRGAHYTKIRRPVRLLYSEQFETLSEALRRERALKRLSRSEKRAMIKMKQENIVNMEHFGHL